MLQKNEIIPFRIFSIIIPVNYKNYEVTFYSQTSFALYLNFFFRHDTEKVFDA